MTRFWDSNLFVMAAITLVAMALCALGDDGIVAVDVAFEADADNGVCVISPVIEETLTKVQDFEYSGTFEYGCGNVQITIKIGTGNEADITLSFANCGETPPCTGFFWQELSEPDIGEGSTSVYYVEDAEWRTYPSNSTAEFTAYVDYEE